MRIGLANPRVVLCVAIGTALLWPRAANAQKSDRELLEGSWVCVATLMDGKPVPAYVGVKATIEGDYLVWYFPQKDGGYRRQDNKFRIDDTKNPKHFDWWVAGQGDWIDLRIYNVSEGEFRIATNLDGKTRPSNFNAAKWVFTCKRTTDIPQIPKATPAKPPVRKPTELAHWGTVINPDNDCTIRSENGRLTIAIPGTKHDLFYGGTDPARRFNAPRVLRTVTGDFVARVRVSGDWQLTPDASYNGAGLLVWHSENQYLRLERNRYVRSSEPRGPHSYVTPLYDHNGQRATHKTSTQDFFPGRSSWLRIERIGNTFKTAVSQNGNTWVETGALETEFPATIQLGVFAINTSSRGCKAEFDEFKVLRE